VKKITLFLFLIIVTTMMVPNGSQANVLENLPRTLETKQWKVTVGKPDHFDQKLNKSTRPTLYNVYSLDIQNNDDENIELVRIEAYKNTPESASTLYELFTAEYDEDKPLGSSFHHSNFPLDTKATALIVSVTWQNKNNDQRKYKEQFIFQLSR
jgi:glycogen synthase